MSTIPLLALLLAGPALSDSGSSRDEFSPRANPILIRYDTCPIAWPDQAAPLPATGVPSVSAQARPGSEPQPANSWSRIVAREVVGRLRSTWTRFVEFVQGLVGSDEAR